MRDVIKFARRKIVEYINVLPKFKQMFSEVAANKTRTPGYKTPVTTRNVTRWHIFFHKVNPRKMNKSTQNFAFHRTRILPCL
jgi:hypothetical protein